VMYPGMPQGSSACQKLALLRRGVGALWGGWVGGAGHMHDDRLVPCAWWLCCDAWTDLHGGQIRHVLFCYMTPERRSGSNVDHATLAHCRCSLDFC